MSCINDIEKLEEKRRQYKEWYEDNKERRKQYKKDNKEHITKKNKEWYEANRDRILEQKKEYKEENKEALTQRTDCKCGGFYQHKHKSEHEKTKRHQAFLKQVDQIH